MDGRVAVLGSANADLVVEVPRRPAGGETLTGSDLQLHAGGKGANQAAAAARAGARTRFFGCVGADGNGALLRESLSAAGVDVDGLRVVDRPTGTAMILVTPDGENSIVLSPGANHAVDVATAEAMSPWADADILVLNLEIPHASVQCAVEGAVRAGVRVVLNAAPAATVPDEVIAVCDPLVVNEHEARIVLGEGQELAADDFAGLARALLARGARSVVITLGAAGAIVADAEGLSRVAAHRVEVVDTTGAGDAFVGATACELARGADLASAVGFATGMAALSVQRKGAQTSYADRAAVEEFLRTV